MENEKRNTQEHDFRHNFHGKHHGFHREDLTGEQAYEFFFSQNHQDSPEELKTDFIALYDLMKNRWKEVDQFREEFINKWKDVIGENFHKHGDHFHRRAGFHHRKCPYGRAKCQEPAER